MSDTRVWRYCWREEPEVDDNDENGRKGKIVAELFDSEADVPDDGCWGKNVAHARILAGLDYDPAIHGNLPEGVQPKKKPGRPRKKKPETDDD